MYHVLNADYLLATVLACKESVSFDWLDELRKRIEHDCPGVAVDVSSPAIESALECYPEIFERRSDQIVRAPNASRYLASDYLGFKFVNRIPKEVHRMVKAAISGTSH